jgi:hypothetical protein
MTSENPTTYTILLEVAYDDNSLKFFSDLRHTIEEKYPLVHLEGYNESSVKYKKKAFALKGHWAAKKNPFAIICDAEGIPVMGFYSEVKECTVDNILRHLDSFLIYKKKENESSSN